MCPPPYSAAGVSASFGEMLLLVAMYFHSNQLSSIIELVCSTLGMKVRWWEGDSGQYISLADQLLAPLLHCSSDAYRDDITDETLAACAYLLIHSIPCSQFAVL